MKKGTIEQDVLSSGASKTDEKGNIKDQKAFVRWKVFGIGEESGPCWTNKVLHNCYTKYYLSNNEKKEQGICMVYGEKSTPAKLHAKGIVALNGNAKLISANDSTNYTYRGRFFTEQEALSVSYDASQKAHNALRWLIANQGVYFGGRMFLCWNPEGKEIPSPMGIMSLNMKEDNPTFTPSDYKDRLKLTLIGWKSRLNVESKIITAVFDAATSGRLSLAYYSELYGNDFVDRIGYWDETCCWQTWKYGIQSPSIRKVAEYAFGTLRTDHFEADDRILKNAILRLVSCRLDKAKFPQDIERMLVKRVSLLYLYNDDKSSKWLRRDLLFVTCAVIRKYYIDYYKEEWEMALDCGKKDRSYQYGRLLAVLEKIERDTYDKNTDRETNAIRMQSVFTQRPQYASRIITEQVKRAYYSRLSVRQKVFYEKLIGQIMEILSEFEEDANKPLNDTYILGYYLQKNKLYPGKNDEDNAEEE